jgi:hypothetical protein
MKGVVALRMQGANRRDNRSMKRGPDKGRSQEAQFQISLSVTGIH